MMRIKRRGTMRRAFTLIELVVSISVILLLVGLTLTAGTAVIERAERARTETTLQLLDQAVREWERTADRKLTWGTNNVPQGAVYDIHELTPEIFIISAVLETIERVESVKSILADIEPKFMYRYKAGKYPPWVESPDEESDMDESYDGTLTVLDAWGLPIYLTHFGAVFDPAIHPPQQIDADGTTRTQNEHKYGVTTSRRICFVSAGPDGEFGNLSAPEDSDEFARTRDNLYSYPVLHPPDTPTTNPPPPPWPEY